MRRKNFDFFSKRKERILFLFLLQKFALGWNTILLGIGPFSALQKVPIFIEIDIFSY